MKFAREPRSGFAEAREKERSVSVLLLHHERRTTNATRRTPQTSSSTYRQWVGDSVNASLP
ncbi:hypothetical protein SLEP1_g27779 [Rubroshorea leprosula]|uniref:Uncharacterized protein n=1 Tax=Rubroshorea leprosula TaxID=152421 RepID=A0AAV5JXJ0_9ROSI|nr:hypothetical protein SLEP1_g27779 [Rubroshorea leprosula]